MSATASGRASGTQIASLERSFVLVEGCPVCRELEQAERRWIGYFVAEAHGAPKLRQALSMSAGFCPRHTRRLLREPGAEEAIPGLWPLLAHAGLRVLEDGSELAECPACEVEGRALRRSVALVRRVMADSELAAPFIEVGGACLPHACALLAVAPEAERRVLLRALRRRLECGGSLEGLAGADPDAGVRAALRERLPNGAELAAGLGTSTLGLARARWRVDSCCVCLSAGLRERRYLDWLAVELVDDAAMIDREPFRCCSRHLHDLWETSPAAAPIALDRLAADWTTRSERYASARGNGGGSSRRFAWAALRGGAGDGHDVVLGALLREPVCGACAAAELAARRELELVDAVWESQSARRAFAEGHGLCVRHSLGTADEIAAVTHARLRILAWEADEARRKRSWSYRHEPPGPERDVHLRVLGQLDGRAYLGGPAGALPC